MKVTANREDLARTLAWVSRALMRRPHLPILSAVKLSASEGLLQVSAFDYERAHDAAVATSAYEPGTIAVGGELLRSLVSGLAGEEITLTADGSHLIVAAGRSRYTAPLMRIEEFPELPKNPPAVGGVEAEALRDLLRQVTHAARDDTSVNAEIRGLYLTADRHSLRAVACDQYRLASAIVAYDGDRFSTRVPVAALTEAVKILDGEIEIGIAENRIGLATESHRVVLTTIAEEYVRWERLWRTEHPGTLRVNRVELMGALKRLQLVMDPDMSVILGITDPSTLRLSADSERGAGTETVPTDAQGVVPNVHVGPEYLLDTLAAIDSETVSIHVDGSTKPLIIAAPNHDARHVVIARRPI